MNKSSYIKSLCLCAVLLFAGVRAYAQQTETSVFINGTLPVAQFNNAVELEPFGSFAVLDRNNIGKGASAGLGFTGRFGLWFDVGVGELQPYAEASVLWNNSGSKIRKAYDNHADSLGKYPTFPQYLNIPVMLGLKYRYNLMPDVRPFAEVAIGYDMLIITRNGYPSQSYRYKLTGELAWMAGIGTYLGEFVSVNLYYMGLGNHYIEYTAKSASPTEEIFEGRPSSRMGVMGLRVGFHF